jgi:hypothetical protein
VRTWGVRGVFSRRGGWGGLFKERACEGVLLCGTLRAFAGQGEAEGDESCRQSTACLMAGAWSSTCRRDILM